RMLYANAIPHQVGLSSAVESRLPEESRPGREPCGRDHEEPSSMTPSYPEQRRLIPEFCKARRSGFGLAPILGTLSYPPFARRLGLEAVRRPVGETAWAEQALVAAGAFTAVAATAASNGAYFPTSWGWAAIAFGWTAVVLVVIRAGLRLSVLELGSLAAVWALTGWIALSTTWTDSVTQSVPEVEHALVYATGLTACLVAVRRRDAPFLVGGVLVGIVVISSYSLATRLFPERLAVPHAIAVN